MTGATICKTSNLLDVEPLPFRVLVTGATGFVGRHIVGALRSRGLEVHATARRPPADDDLSRMLGVHWWRCDLLAPAAATLLMNEVRPTHLIHSAWVMEPGAVWSHPDNLSWVGASLTLARNFSQAGGRRLVLVGTCAEYAWNGERCAEATTPLIPASLYGATKLATGAALQAYAPTAGLSFCSARLFNLYGPHEDKRRLVAGAIEALLAGRSFAATSGVQLRDFMHVEDAGEALAAILMSEVEGPINVASGADVTIATLLRELARLAGREALLELGAVIRQPGDPDRLVADVKRLREVGVLPPRRSLKDGLATMLDSRGAYSA